MIALENGAIAFSVALAVGASLVALTPDVRAEWARSDRPDRLLLALGIPGLIGLAVALLTLAAS
jgi:hypothetical protein